METPALSGTTNALVKGCRTARERRGADPWLTPTAHPGPFRVHRHRLQLPGGEDETTATDLARRATRDANDLHRAEQRDRRRPDVEGSASCGAPGAGRTWGAA